MLDWLKTKLYLDAISPNAKKRQVKRGQVYKCNFGYGVGSEMQKERPCVILQNDIGNMKSSNTIVAPITHDTSQLPCMALVATQVDAQGNILLDGQVNTSNTVCISKARLGDYITDLTGQDMNLVDEALAKTIGLMSHYSNLQKKLSDKLTYIERIKKDRNEAQDFISELQKEMGVSSQEELKEAVTKLANSIDT